MSKANLRANPWRDDTKIPIFGGRTYQRVYDKGSEYPYRVVVRDSKDAIVDVIETSNIRQAENFIEHIKRYAKRHPGQTSPQERWAMNPQENPKPVFAVKVYEETLTWEDPEDPDGYEIEHDEVVDDDSASLEDVIDYANRYGVMARDSSDGTGWWESESSQDYRTGDYTSHTMHVKMNGKDVVPWGPTESTFNRINRLIAGDDPFKPGKHTRNNPSSKLKNKLLR